MDDQHSINEREWGRAENWTGWLGAYRSQRDTRLWVPKRNATHGWSPNLAHQPGRLFMLAMLIVPVVLVVVLVLAVAFR